MFLALKNPLFFILQKDEWNWTIHIYVAPSINFQTVFVQAFKFVVDSWKFNMLLLYILWDDWPVFMISDSNQELQ